MLTTAKETLATHHKSRYELTPMVQLPPRLLKEMQILEADQINILILQMSTTLLKTQ